MARPKKPRKTDKFAAYVEHPLYGRGPHYTGLNPQTNYNTVFLHWHSGDKCRIPDTAIEADVFRQHRATVHVTHYYDVLRDCRDCGRPFLFFAQEQKHWYEKLGFPLEADCVRCPECRKRQQHIGRLRSRYEKLHAMKARGEKENLEMASCAVALMEEGIFTPKSAPAVRRLLKGIGPEKAQALRDRLAGMDAKK